MATRLLALTILSVLFTSVTSHNFLISGDDGWATAQARAQYDSLVAAGFDVGLPKVDCAPEADSILFFRSFCPAPLKYTMVKATGPKHLQLLRVRACSIRAQQDPPPKALTPTIVSVAGFWSFLTANFCICSSSELRERLWSGRG